MFIKRRLTISNILMLVIPVILITSIAGIIRGPFFRLFEEKSEYYRRKSAGSLCHSGFNVDRHEKTG